MRMLSFAFKSMATRRAKLVMTALSVVIAASVALLAYDISTQVSEGIVNTATPPRSSTSSSGPPAAPPSWR